MKPDVVNVEHKAMETTDSSNYRHIWVYWAVFDRERERNRK
jgi:hypothetical protein